MARSAPRTLAAHRGGAWPGGVDAAASEYGWREVPEQHPAPATLRLDGDAAGRLGGPGAACQWCHRPPELSLRVTVRNRVGRLSRGRSKARVRERGRKGGRDLKGERDRERGRERLGDRESKTDRQRERARQRRARESARDREREELREEREISEERESERSQRERECV